MHEHRRTLSTPRGGPWLPIATLCACLACTFFGASLNTNALPTAQQTKETAKKPKDRPTRWNPPDVDAPLKSISVSPPCPLSDVLQQAGARADEMIDNLQNFTADETIQYQSLPENEDLTGQFSAIMPDVPDAGIGTFEYLVMFSSQSTGTSIQESRTPTKGTQPFPASTQDTGLPEMALIFLPSIQADYDMTCAGSGAWDGQSTWVIHFQQRKDKPSHTLSYRDKGGVYPAKLKGRAWIAQDSGQVMHLETSLMEGIPMMRVKNLMLSIDYAPVQFHSQNVRIWLPQNVEAYGEFMDRRTIIYHTFSNFMLFSVQTKQEVEKPKQPQ